MNTFPAAPDWQVSQWFNTDQPLSLVALRGKVIVLHAFQLLCPACVSDGVPLAERVHRLFTGGDVVVIGLHTVFEHHAAMSPVALRAFLHEYRITHPVGVDAAVTDDPIPATMRAYEMQGTPSLIVIDREGRIRQHSFGRADPLALGVLLGLLVAEDNVAQESGRVGSCCGL